MRARIGQRYRVSVLYEWLINWLFWRDPRETFECCLCNCWWLLYHYSDRSIHHAVVELGAYWHTSSRGQAAKPRVTLRILCPRMLGNPTAPLSLASSVRRERTNERTTRDKKAPDETRYSHTESRTRQLDHSTPNVQSAMPARLLRISSSRRRRRRKLTETWPVSIVATVRGGVATERIENIKTYNNNELTNHLVATRASP